VADDAENSLMLRVTVDRPPEETRELGSVVAILVRYFGIRLD
jgi:hypothetical protein